MGNKFSTHPPEMPQLEPVNTFKFHENFPEDTNNGLYFHDIYIPEEIVIMILSWVDPKELLNATLVCKKWCNIIKSEQLWAEKYWRECGKKAKKLPWYVYYCFFTTRYFRENLIKNGNGQEQFKHWKIIFNYGDSFRIEDPPCGADSLPPDIPEFNGKTSCFATSYFECNKLQEISLERNRLMQLILNKYKPHIYLSEWVAGRFDCGCVYNLWCKLIDRKSDFARKKTNYLDSDDSYYTDSTEDSPVEPLHMESVGYSVEQWAGSTWSKIELIVKNYPEGVTNIIFQHEGKDTQFWKGHYGSKMAGGVLRILFDTIEPLA